MELRRVTPENQRPKYLSFRAWVLPILAIVASLGAASCAQVNSESARTQEPASQSKIVFIPNAVDFSAVVLGQKNTQTIRMSNQDTGSIQINNILVAGPGFTITGLTFPFSLAPQASRTFNVGFAPKATGPASGTLTVESSLGTSETLSVKGVGTNVLPKLQTNPTSINFGKLGVNGTAAQTVKVLNTGNANVTVNQVVVSGSGFSYSGLPPKFELAPLQETSFLVSFHPKAKGVVAGSLKFITKDLSAALTVSLAGDGINAGSTPSPSAHTVKLSWNASTSKISGYHVYRGEISGGPYTRLTGSVITGLEYSDNNVESGHEYFYVATSVDTAGTESLYSQQTSATIPNP